MNRHVHADKIIAKAENMDLVVIMKKPNNTWVEANNQDTTHFNSAFTYFLCLEEHKEACLHWLNGNMVEVFRNDEWLKVSLSYVEWTSASLFMNSETSIRIKPKKEKRYIVTFPWCGNNEYVTPSFFNSIGQLEEYVHLHYGMRDSIQIIEIEVEV